MNVSPDGYAHMTHMLSALAGGKLLLALEVPQVSAFHTARLLTRFAQGGYNVNAIAESAYACVKVIVGDELPVMSSIGAASLAATNTVHDVRRMQAQYWKCMGEAVLSQEELSKAGKIESLSGAFAPSLRGDYRLNRSRSAEVLKKHRLYELWHEYGLFDVEFNSPTLEEAYSNQLLVSCVSSSLTCDSG